MARGGERVLPESVAHLIDLLHAWGPVGARHMFGGIGLYRGGVMFGLVVDDIVYFKVDDENRADYEKAGATPFRYQRGGRSVALSYWTVPDEVTEDRDTLVEWAKRADAAALRAAARDRRLHMRER
jgi:DNA transformation protein